MCVVRAYGHTCGNQLLLLRLLLLLLLLNWLRVVSLKLVFTLKLYRNLILSFGRPCKQLHQHQQQQQQQQQQQLQKQQEQQQEQQQQQQQQQQQYQQLLQLTATITVASRFLCSVLKRRRKLLRLN